MNHHANEILCICGIDELDDFHSRKITHMIRITNPGIEGNIPTWFTGECLHLSFGDVVSTADAAAYNTKAPSVSDIRNALLFARSAWSVSNSRLLVSCDYGASRSPALAYVILADRLGAGRESESFKLVMDIRPEAVPNDLVVRIGDAILKRQGKLLQPLMKLYTDISSW